MHFFCAANDPPPAADAKAVDVSRVALIACAVLEIELEQLTRDVPHMVECVMLEQGLHNEPPRLRVKLQEAVDALEARRPDLDAIVLGYGLCSRGIEGVTTRRCRLIAPRAHDCITLLLGCRHRYAEYVARHPGTYWYSPGWNKHHTPPGPQRHAALRAKYVEQFGEDNADYLMESEQHWFATYSRATYVHLTIGATEQDKQFTRHCADWLGWNYDEQQGDPELLRTLLAGPWDDDRFVVLKPGQTFAVTADDRVITAVENCDGSAS